MSDAEEEALANDYREAVQYDGMDDLDRVPSVGSGDIQAQLAAAATHLDLKQRSRPSLRATTCNYSNLFHHTQNVHYR